MNKNIPFTQEQVASLKAGFTSSGIYPNRRARRKHLNKKYGSVLTTSWALKSLINAKSRLYATLNS